MDSDNKRKRKSRFFPGLLFGIVLGWLAASVTPQSWQDYVPDVLRPGGLVDGEVVEKSTESGRLLLKLTTDRGMILATFNERQEEIDLLVETGDVVTIRVQRYQPFLDDPPIERVGRPPGGGEAPSPSSVPATEEPALAPAPTPEPEPDPEPVREDDVEPEPAPSLEPVTTTSIPGS